MHRRPLLALAAGAALFVAACSSGAATEVPSAAASAAPSVEATAEPSAPAAGAACTPSSTAGEVAVSIENFAFNPADITASVGQTVTFTNGDSATHTATLDDGSCTTPNLANGESGGLMFSAAGTYPFHCNVHPNMKGTITVS